VDCLGLAATDFLVKARKPLLAKHHLKAHLKFCEKYKSWNNADWARVIFSNEHQENIKN
jgi:hypothetical protein